MTWTPPFAPFAPFAKLASSLRPRGDGPLRRSMGVAALSAAALAVPAMGQLVVFNTESDNGFFVPFHSGNADTVKYADSGWLGGPDAPPVVLQSITLRLATLGAENAGTTDIRLTINDGDPSGLVFGTGALLHETVIRGVTLPAAGEDATFFSIDVALPNVMTTGGFNDLGWSLALENFSFEGSFGFQVGSCAAQTVGFYTNNASSFDGDAWSLFAFGPDPCAQIAQYSVTVIGIPPSPADFNGDGVVNGDDLGTLLGQWGVCLQCEADFNADGLVDGDDLGVLLGDWSAVN